MSQIDRRLLWIPNSSAKCSACCARAATGMTMIIVTREIRFARDVADRVVFIDGGMIVEQGTPEEVLERPKPERTRRFLSVIEGEAAAEAA